VLVEQATALMVEVEVVEMLLL